MANDQLPMNYYFQLGCFSSTINSNHTNKISIQTNVTKNGEAFTNKLLQLCKEYKTLPRRENIPHLWLMEI